MPTEISSLTPILFKKVSPNDAPNSPVIPRSPDYSPPDSPVYSPKSPAMSSEEGILDKAKTALDDANTSLGELGDSISSSVSNAVTGAEDALKSGLDSLSAMIPGSPQSPQSAGGPFASGQMNQVFNSLAPDKRATIMQLGGGQREQVMAQIMSQVSRQSQSGGLNQYFTGLPVADQLSALQNTYSKKATQFKQLAGAVNAPQTSIIRPHSAAEEMYGGSLNLFAPIVEADSKKSNSSDEGDNKSSDTSTSSSGNVKVIKM